MSEPPDRPEPDRPDTDAIEARNYERLALSAAGLLVIGTVAYARSSRACSAILVSSTRPAS